MITRRLFLGGVAVLGCRGTPMGSRRDPVPLLRAIVARVILPTLRMLEREAATLDQTAVSLADPTSLASVRTAWKTTRRALRLADAFRFGPADDLRIQSAIDWFPPRVESIEAALAAGAFDAAAIDALGANAKGLLALEVLLFDRDRADTELLAAGRPEYIRGLTAAIARKTVELRTAWDPGGYALALEGARAPYPTPFDAVSALVNGSIAALETVAGTRIGKPFGSQSGGVPQPDLEEAPRSDDSLASITASLESVRDVYGSDLGLSALVRDRSTRVDDDVRTAMSASFAALAAITPPLRVALGTQRAAVQVALDAIRKWKALLAADVSSVLGVTVRFTDNDGD